MYTYTAYGLNIHSSIKLPELIESNADKLDVVIKFDKLNYSPVKDSSPYYNFEATTEGLYIYWKEIGTLLISQGKEIILDTVIDAEESRLRLFILGAAIGTILHQRGYIVLHASAVSLKNNGVVFTADKRRGKSTMAAALHKRGHSLIADDVVAIDFDKNDRPIVYPAFPQLKLWPDAVTYLGKNPQDLPQLTTKLKKRDYLPKNNFVTKPLILKQIFVLSQGSEITVEPLSFQEIMLYLLHNTYVTRFGSSLLPSKDPSHFLKLTKLAKSTSVKRLVRPNSIELLSEVAQKVENYLLSQSNNS